MCPRSERSDLSTHHNSVKTGGLHCSPFPAPDGKESKSFGGLDACGILLRWFRLGWPVVRWPQFGFGPWNIMEDDGTFGCENCSSHRRTKKRCQTWSLWSRYCNRRVLLGGGLMNDFATAATYCCNPKVPSSKALLTTYSGRFPWSSPVDDSHVEQGSPLYSTPEQGETGQLRIVFPSRWCGVCLKKSICVLKVLLEVSPPQKVTPMFFEIMIDLLYLVAIWLVIFILGHLSEVFEVFSLGKVYGKSCSQLQVFFLLWAIAVNFATLFADQRERFDSLNTRIPVDAIGMPQHF